jgi:hypothetical protein
VRRPAKAAAFLAAMQPEVAEPAKAAPPPAVRKAPRAAAIPAPGRAGLKHFGGYLDDDTMEKIAVLRTRLKKDNSALIKLAIEELYSKHKAKRAFGDV